MTQLPDTIMRRELPEGRVLVVYPLTFARARLTIGDADNPLAYDDAWDYPTVIEAILACAEYTGTGDPPGQWLRNLNTGRRRQYADDGRLIREWIPIHP